ncbi:MAG TPA: prenyltransferase/squalene oxidase repeat-containing protein [Syntrophorhabdales bacterium]|nr:prenyltransferase/squalene oxidase repeat-containing protein [Syntrophorhabdales bacterium]
MKRKIFYGLVLSLLLIPSIVLGADTLPKALGYIVSMQEPDGGWSRVKGEFPPETEVTSWAVKVLVMNNMEKERVDKGVAFILKDQKPGGDWNNNTAHTAFALMAMSQVKKGQVNCMNGVEYLRKVQDPAGGFKRIGTEGAPLTIYTSVVLCALADLGYPKEDATVKKALEWLVSCQNPDGGFGMPKGSPSVAAATGWAIRALIAYETDPGSPSVKNAVEWLLKLQKSSGGFSMVPPAPEDPEVTAYAIMGLIKVPGQKDAIAKAAEYLAKAQLPDGAYISDFPQQFDKKAKKNTQTTCFVAWALSEAK